MRSHEYVSATGAPPISPEILRRARVLARVSVSPAVAGVLAGFAFPVEGRDHNALLVDVMAERATLHREVSHG